MLAITYIQNLGPWFVLWVDCTVWQFLGGVWLVSVAQLPWLSCLLCTDLQRFSWWHHTLVGRRAMCEVDAGMMRMVLQKKKTVDHVWSLWTPNGLFCVPIGNPHTSQKFSLPEVRLTFNRGSLKTCIPESVTVLSRPTLDNHQDLGSTYHRCSAQQR